MLAERIAIQGPGLGDVVDVGDLALGEDVVSDKTSSVDDLRRKLEQAQKCPA